MLAGGSTGSELSADLALQVSGRQGLSVGSVYPARLKAEDRPLGPARSAISEGVRARGSGKTFKWLAVEMRVFRLLFCQWE